ncbi:MAG: hypothetical protein JWO92_2538 [Chitinophagaceae bacterium]|nr:hypothetical protein [Chitinophagaceae bacterium]
MKEKLEANGWKMYYECNTCAGHKQFYKNDAKEGYEVRIKVKNQTFSILLKNMVIAGPFWGYQIEEKLKKHVP